MRKIGFSLFFINFFIQRVLRYNGKFMYMLHFTSRIRVPDKFVVQKVNSSVLFRCLAESPNVYIQAINDIHCFSDLYIAPGVRLISANHSPKNLAAHVTTSPIVIGKNVWLGAGCVILPGVHIGDNVIIGAGSVVTKSIPENSIAVGNPCKVIKENVCS